MRQTQARLPPGVCVENYRVSSSVGGSGQVVSRTYRRSPSLQLTSGQWPQVSVGEVGGGGVWGWGGGLRDLGSCSTGDIEKGVGAD